MAQPGWISIHRKIRECAIWLDDEPFDKRSAWIDILLTANHETRDVTLGAKAITVERGSFITSQAKLCARWHWGVGRVRRYLDLLQELNMITWKAERKWTVVKVLKYSTYQVSSNKNGTITERQRNDNGTITETNNNDITMSNNENNVDAVAVVNTKYDSRASSSDYNPVLSAQNMLGLLSLSPFQVELFVNLYKEVGEAIYQRSLEKAAKAGARNFNYVDKVARGIAAGDDYDEQKKHDTGKLDFDAAMAKAVAAMEKKKNA